VDVFFVSVFFAEVDAVDLEDVDLLDVALLSPAFSELDLDEGIFFSPSGDSLLDAVLFDVALLEEAALLLEEDPVLISGLGSSSESWRVEDLPVGALLSELDFAALGFAPFRTGNAMSSAVAPTATPPASAAISKTPAGIRDFRKSKTQFRNVVSKPRAEAPSPQALAFHGAGPGAGCNQIKGA